MEIIAMPLILEIPFILSHERAITTYVPPPYYIWPTVNLENATALMNLDGHEIIIKGNKEQWRLRNLLFLSSKSQPNKMLLEACITGKIEQETKEGFYAQQIFSKILVSEIRFQTNTEILQEEKEAEIFTNSLLEDLKKFLKKSE